MRGETGLDLELGDLCMVVLALGRDESKFGLEADDGLADVCLLLGQGRGDGVGRLEFAGKVGGIGRRLIGLFVEDGEAEAKAAGVAEVLGSHGQVVSALWGSER